MNNTTYIDQEFETYVTVIDTGIAAVEAINDTITRLSNVDELAIKDQNK